MVVHLPKRLAEQMREHAESTYPEECCGILLGLRAGGDVRILRVRGAPNASTSQRGARFVLHPRDLLAAEDEGEEGIVGFYHSHPDVPASPSSQDVEHAWPDYTYLIVSVLKGTSRHISAWSFAARGKTATEETLVLA